MFEKHGKAKKSWKLWVSLTMGIFFQGTLKLEGLQALNIFFDPICEGLPNLKYM